MESSLDSRWQRGARVLARLAVPGAAPRRLLPIGGLITVILGALVIEAGRDGLRDGSFGTALLVAASALLSTGLTLAAATALRRSDRARVEGEAERARLVDELRRLNEELERRVARRTIELTRSNDELRQFAYVASHDLRAPLHAIGTLSAWIEEDMAPILQGESLQHMRLLRARVRRLDRLLLDLLEYSRVGCDDGQISLVDTGGLAAQTVALANVPPDFVVTVAPDMPVFETAVLPLRCCLLNLVDNALKHHDRAAGHVEISSRATRDHWEFIVSDDGPGIAPEFQQRVFQLFQTLRPRDRVEGSGMGLAMVKKTVEWAGGAVELESSGRGATFRFTWPRRWEARRLGAASSPPAATAPAPRAIAS